VTWTLFAFSVPTDIGHYRVELERDGDKTAHLVTFPDNRQLRVLPDGVHSGQYRIRVVKVALTVLRDVEAHSESLPVEYEPMLYLIGSLCYADLEWEQVSGGESIEDWMETWFHSPLVDRLTLIQDLNKAGWVIRREDEV